MNSTDFQWYIWRGLPDDGKDEVAEQLPSAIAQTTSCGSAVTDVSENDEDSEVFTFTEDSPQTVPAEGLSLLTVPEHSAEALTPSTSSAAS